MHDKTLNYLFETNLPIIQAPMAGVQDSDMTIAVCQVGGIGSLACGMLSIEKMISEIKRIKAVTEQPYALNFFCHEMPEYDEQQQLQWQETLAPYFAELGMSAAPPSHQASRQPFSHDIADAIEPFQPALLSFHFGLPDTSLLSRIKQWNCHIISSATTLEEARWLEAQGVDGIIAQGVEAGGHRGMFLSDDLSTQVSTSTLVAQIAKHVTVPVIASGGIGDAQGVQNALALGASAVNIGTAYLLCTEANTSSLHRAAIKSHSAQHTALTNVFSGRAARGITNRIMRELGYMSSFAPAFPYASVEMTQLRKQAEKHQIDDFSPLWCGQNTRACKEISAGELTLQLVADLR